MDEKDGWERPDRGGAGGGNAVSRADAIAALMAVGLDRHEAERVFESIVRAEREAGRRASDAVRDPQPGGYPLSVGRSAIGFLSVSDAFNTARPSCKKARWLFLSGNDR